MRLTKGGFKKKPECKPISVQVNLNRYYRFCRLNQTKRLRFKFTFLAGMVHKYFFYIMTILLSKIYVVKKCKPNSVLYSKKTLKVQLSYPYISAVYGGAT